MKENNKVIDEETKELVSPGEMIKRLMKRAGMKRNQLHEEMKKYMPTNRSIGEPSRLSDIFSGKHRTLPLVDLKPLMDAIKMPEALRDFYICEILKGYLPKQLSPYITSKRINKRSMLNTLLIEDLKERNRVLIQENQYLKSMEGDFELKYKPEPNPRASNIIANPPPVKIEDYFDKLEGNQLSEFNLELPNESVDEDKPMAKNLPDIEDRATYFQKWQEKKMSKHFEYELSSQSAYESNIAYKKEKELWCEAIQEIEKNQNNDEFLYFLKLLFPNDFQELIYDFFQNCQEHKNEDSKEQWAWVRGRLISRSLSYVCGDLFIRWKKQNPEAFLMLDEYYKKAYDKEKDDKIKFIPQKHIIDSYMKCDGISFSSYLSKLWSQLSKSCPSLYSLMSPWKGQRNINTVQDEKNTFFNYFDFIDSGWKKKITFDQRYQLSSPSAVFDSVFVKKLRNVVIGCLSSTGIAEKKPSIKDIFLQKTQTLCDVYINYDDLNLKYDSCLKFLNKKLQSCNTKDDAIQKSHSLIFEYSKKGVSQSIKDKSQMLTKLSNSIQPRYHINPDEYMGKFP